MSAIISKNKSSVYLETPIKQQPGDKDFLQFKNNAVNIKLTPISGVISYGTTNQIMYLSNYNPVTNSNVHVPTNIEADILFTDTNKQIQKKRARLAPTEPMFDFIKHSKLAITFNGNDVSYTNGIKSNWKQFTKNGITGASADMSGITVNGKYATFNGDNFIELTKSLNMAKISFTISAWINMAGNSWPTHGHNTIVGGSGTGNDKVLHFAICANKPNYIRLGFLSDDIDIKTPIQPKENKWRHVVWVHNTDTKVSKLYVDGTLAGSGTHKNQYEGNISFIGDYSPSASDTFHGYIRDVLVMEGVYGEDVIDALYSSKSFKAHRVNISNLNLPTTPLKVVKPFDAKMLLSADMAEDTIEPEIIPVDFRVNENNELIVSSKVGKGGIYVDGVKYSIENPAMFNDNDFKPDPFDDGSCLLNLPMNGTLLDYANKGASVNSDTDSIDVKTKFENDPIMGKVTKFNGNGDVVFINMPSKLKTTFAITTWFKLSDFDHSWCLAGADYNGVPPKDEGFDWWLDFRPNYGLFMHWGREDKGEVNWEGFKNIKENEWYFGYFEYSQKQMRAKYFNVKGELVYNFVFNNPADLVQTFATTFTVGGSWSNTAPGNKWASFKGSIKQFKLFNRALNNIEIQTLLQEKVDPEFKLEIPDLEMKEAPKLIYKVRPKALIPITEGKPKLGVNTELIEDGLIFHSLYGQDLTDRVTGKKMITNTNTITMDLSMGITGHKLNSNTDFVSLPNKSAIALSSKISLSFWIYGDNYNVNGNTLFNLGSHTFELQVMSGILQIAAGRIKGDWNWTPMCRIDDKKAYHITAIGDFENNTYKVYVNGKKVFDFRADKTAMIGKENKIGTVGLMCRLDQTSDYCPVKDIYASNYRIYNRLLTDSEITLLANEFKTFDPKVDRFMINKPIKSLNEVNIGLETVIPKNNLINSISLKNTPLNSYEVCRVEVLKGKLNITGNVALKSFNGGVVNDPTMGEVLTFDKAKQQYLQLSNSPFALNAIKRNIAIAGWIYVEDPNNGAILTNDSSGYNGYGVGVYKNTFWFDIRNSDGKNNAIRDVVIDKISANIPVKGKWYHLAFNYKVDNGNLIIDAYANGFKYRHEELSLSNYYVGNRDSLVFIGGIALKGNSFTGQSGGELYTTCKVKEVRYFNNYNLTPDDIEQLMTGYKTELQLGVDDLPIVPAVNSNTTVLDISKIDINGNITFSDSTTQSRTVQRGLILDANVNVLPPFTTNIFKLK